MAVPIIASSTSDTTGGTTNTTVVLTEPSGISAGDLIILLFADEQSNTNDSPDLSGQGFTRITHSNNSQDCQMAIYWKIASGSESWPITIAGTSGDYAVGWALRITGIDTVTPIHKTGAFGGVGSTGGTAVAAEVTPTVDECLGLAFGCYDGSDIAPASVSGTGWSLIASLEDPSNNSGGAAADYATKTLTTAASVDCTFTMSASDGRVAIQIAISPPIEGIASIDPTEFDMDNGDIDINGLDFEASQGSGTVYISDADTLAGSANEVEIAGGVNTWSDTVINLDLTGLSGTELDNLHTLGPGTRYIIVVNNSSTEYGSSAITLHRPEAFVMSLGAGTPGASTARLDAPATKTTGDFDAGRFEEAANPATAVDITLDDYTEMVWSIEGKALSRGVQYDFRVTKSGTIIDTYTLTPQVTISAGVSVTVLPDVLEGVGELQTPTISVEKSVTVLPDLLEGVGELQTPTIIPRINISVLTELLEGVGELQTPTYIVSTNIAVLVDLLEGVGELQTPTISVVKAPVVLLELLEGIGELQTPTYIPIRNITALVDLLEGVGELQTPTVSIGVAVSVLIELLEGVGELQTPIISPVINLTALPDLLEGVGELQTPTISPIRHLIALPDLLEGVGELQAPTIITGLPVTVLLGLLEGLGELQAPTISTVRSMAILTDLLEGVGELQDPTLLPVRNLLITPDVLEGVGELQDPTVVIPTAGDVTVIMELLEALGVLQTPTVSTIRNITLLPDLLSGVGSLQTPLILPVKNVTALPELLQGIGELQAPVLIPRRNILITPNVLEGVGSLNDLVIVTYKGVIVTPETLQGLGILQDIQWIETGELFITFTSLAPGITLASIAPAVEFTELAPKIDFTEIEK